MQLDNSAMVVLQRIEDRDLRVATASENPMSIQAKFDVVAVSSRKHMMEFPTALSKFCIVIVISERDSQRF